MKEKLYKRLLLTISALFLLAGLAVYLHLLDFLTTDGRVDEALIGSLVCYWFLTTGGIFLVFKGRERWRELLLAVCTVLATLVIMELALRVLKPPAALPDFQGISSNTYHHLLPKNAEMNAGIFDDKRVIVRTNEDGLRSLYSREAFRNFKTRIAILGDSFTFGEFVRQESAFPAVTERLLRERLHNDSIAVLNAGIISFSPLLEERLFSGIVVHYAPTHVILFLDATDIGDDMKYASEVQGDGDYGDFKPAETPSESGVYTALGNLSSFQLQKIGRYLSYPFSAVRYAWSHGSSFDTTNTSGEARYDYYDFEVKIDGIVERNRFFIYRHPLESTRQYFLKTLSYINRIAAKVNDSGAIFILVVTPRFQHWNPKECPNNWEKGEYALSEPYQDEYFRFFDEAAPRLPYAVLNLLPAFRACEEFPLVFDDDPHWNERGHAFVARVLSAYLAEGALRQ